MGCEAGGRFSEMACETLKEISHVKSKLGSMNFALRKMQKHMEGQSVEFDLQMKCLRAEMETIRGEVGKVSAGGTKVSVPDLQKTWRRWSLKFKSYAEATKAAQTSLLDQEGEAKDRFARAKNLRISGLEEKGEEDVKAEVMRILQEDLKIAATGVEQAFRVGKPGGTTRAVLVKFATVEGKENAVGNRAMLRGKRIWLDPDLTPMQVEAKKREIEKVKKANSEGWVAFMREGQAVVTNKRREDR
ncbi:hypothetical protein R1flu_008315 [Riccia fluitans]|uniref:Uncharacterized protein n=1 Tax=Riccia fluitans TaxID=41844 RepID=A0ABD1YBJ0_9MARC